MEQLSVFQQNGFTARFEWGYEGVQALAPVSDVVVILDVLSFTTCVDVVLSRGGIVYPYRYKDASAVEYAAQVDAKLAGKRGEPISLSPVCLSTAVIEQGERIVLPSPNGATCSFLAKDHQATVIAASLRNAAAVANYLKQHGGVVTVIASGERWPDNSLRPAFEDMVGAGAILSHLTDYRLSPEAQSAAAVFHAVKHDLHNLLRDSASGRELIEKGYPEDVTIAAQINASTIVPILNQAGAYVAATANMKRKAPLNPQV